MQDLSSTLIGKTIGSYRIVRLLGEGGMGVVFLGEHETLKRKVAIKLLRPELAQNAEVVRRFFNEALAANQIQHPGIVDIYDYVQSETGAYLVMEFLEGESLAEHIERSGKLPLERVALLIRRIAAPLSAAHEAGIVHRDLKPDNIFILPDPDHPDDIRVKLLDFGIAKLKVEQLGMHTATGMVLGTPFYMSPEQCHGARAVDYRTDIYALGVLTYQLLSGSLPFFASGFGELVLKLQTEQPPPLDIAALGIPSSVEALVLRAMARDPSDRFSSALEMANALILASGVSLPGMTQPPAGSQQSANLAKGAGASTLPRTVMSSPGLVIPPVETIGEILSSGSPTAPAAISAPTPGASTLAPVTSPPSPVASTPSPVALPALASENRGGSNRSRWPRVLLNGFSVTALLVTLVGVIVVLRDSREGGEEIDEKAHGGGVAVTKTPASLPAVLSTPTHPSSSRPAPTSPDDAPMARVPAGPFRFGVKKRERVLAAFEIDRHEVTVAQYARCVRAGGCDGRKLSGVELPGQVPFRKSDRCNAGHADRASHPQNCVTWHQAAQYCQWAKKRLPTEAEWEKAARGTDGRPWPWGVAPIDCAHAVFKDKAKGEGCGAHGSSAVGSRAPAGDSPYGVRDLVGNVAEWVADDDAARGPKTANKSIPAGSTAIRRRGVRGGSFTNASDELSATSRMALPPTYRLEDVGFRCAR
ncbi:MAG: SUMF1/EgtB/PvdO family nonheme iron enzyme [Deltaproteobacteria bacterium]|nr:SUMF1/EgtB/PvdO family nonheme iron enzyme [Deltaproteobacteria bacterium]